MEQKRQQIVQGTVVKRSNANTIRVTTKVTKVHPIYRKRYTLNKYFTAHDPEGTVEVGDTVTLVGCRPVSKLKHWVIQK